MKTINNSCTVSDKEHCGCFEKLTEEQKELIEKNQVEIKFKKGENICKQGTFAANVMFVCSGLAKIYVEGPSGFLILKIIPSGNFIGLSSLFEGNTIFQYSAVAYQDSYLRLIDISVFRKLLSINAEFATQIINILSENSIQTYGRFFCLTQKQSYGKLADTLLCLSDRVYKKREFDLLLSRRDLAELTNMATESLIRMLKKFKEDKLIKIDGKKIKITNYDKLKLISETG
ncbi:MAG: Crp/Fnr family transcriptional regulator [Chlorobi bacterium]|nr:Crp/Fnr family transcriptional regulator [Chlorobiota bacterium]